MTKEQKPALAIRVWLNKENIVCYDGEISARIETDIVGHGTMETPEFGHIGYDYPGFDKLRFSVRLSSKIEATEQTAYSSLGELTSEESLYRASLRDLESIVSAIKGITKKMDKIEATAGRAGTFGANLLRFASSVGAKAVYFVQSNQYGRTEYKYVGLSSAPFHVDRMIFDWNQKNAPAHAKESVSV